MSQNKLHKQAIAIHPFLFMLFSSLTLVGANFNTVSSWELIRLLFLSLIFAGAVYLLLWVLVRDWLKAGFLASLSIILMFYIDYPALFPDTYKLGPVEINSFWVILILWITIFTLAGSKYFYARFRPQILAKYLNGTAAILVCMPLVQLVASWRISQPITVTQIPNLPSAPEEIQPISSLPDIYYIILDGYGRQDVLRDIYGFDNAGFLNYLRDSGFYIADDSTSNYIQTYLSLSSSLNMQYLDAFRLEKNTSDRAPLAELMSQNRVFQTLEKAGYQSIHIFSGYGPVIEAAHSNISFEADFWLTHIEGLFLQGSGLMEILDALHIQPKMLNADAHRQRILFQLAQLDEVARQPSTTPKLVYTHIISPHPPFVFDSDGNPINWRGDFTLNDGDGYDGSDREYIDGYAAQLSYFNEKLIESITGILQNYEEPPVIILQADHGPGAFTDFNSSGNTCHRERFAILNAYLVPADLQTRLYPTITPVNTFRILFDYFLGTSLGKLPDLNYFSAWKSPYNFEDKTAVSRSPCN